MKTKNSKETVRVLLTTITKNNRPTKNKRTNFAGKFWELCKSEGIQIYSTMSQTEAAIVERTIPCLKKILYRYMENCRYNYIHHLFQLVTILNSKKGSIDLILKKCQEFRLSVHLLKQATARI